MDYDIEAADLKKSFGDVAAVAGVSFSVARGELFGLLGPNGAGKSTTINMLIGLARPDAGRVRVGGVDCSKNPKAAQHLIGVVPDDSNLYPELSGFDNLCFCGALYGMKKADRQARARDLLEGFGLSRAADRKFGGYSKGMKRRLTIAAGIMHQPGILFLDEPTTGIDVESARHIRSLLAGLHGQGTTILLTTHYIDEAERLCGRVAFLVNGEIIRVDTVEKLLEPVAGRHVVRLVCADAVARHMDALAGAFPEYGFEVLDPGSVRVESGAPVRVGPLVRFLEDQGAEVLEARRVRPSLEDVFVRVTGIGAGDVSREKERRGGGA
ncbi:ABC transporter ATP-binding protein [Desulfolutivibrio sulfoxidireducens]|uniref:ABC transporter ATP-binding protein n=1 Tax=Desulfolutivibrio sulfoxidireducens TaxID=2773299 RepID=UPI00159D7AC7|nr:ABC transporter ATP-binding protein [Desulfolutivibrio sulfoxidireducens]QLA18592.1 ATP-binding cassette domain-containing protein [Desulfolutivibrio sulfoxidireducens]